MIKNAESCDPKGIHSFGIWLTTELTAELMLQRAASTGLSLLLQTINYTWPILTPLYIGMHKSFQSRWLCKWSVRLSVQTGVNNKEITTLVRGILEAVRRGRRAGRTV